MTRWQTDEPGMYDPKPTVQDLPLFAPPQARTLARRDDPDTSKEAAVRIADHLTELQARVLAAFEAHGPMNGPTAESLPGFRDCAPSTVRHRITDLHRADRLRLTGKVEDGCRVYEVVERSGDDAHQGI